MTEFVELVAATSYSFLDGASQPSDMVGRAVELGHAGIGIADRNTVAGVVRAFDALKRANAGLLGAQLPLLNFKLATGARLVFADGTPDIVAYPATRTGWGRLTRLLTVGNRRAEKGGCILGLGDLIALHRDLLLIVLPASTARPAVAVPGADLPPMRANPSLAATLAAVQRLDPTAVWLGVTMPRGGRDRRRLATLAEVADAAGVPLLATCDVLYAHREDRDLHDVVTCIREGVTVARAGRLLAANGERHLKDATEMARLFRDRPEAVGQSIALMNRIGFDLTQLRYEYPHEPVPEGWEAQAWLEHLAYQAAEIRFPKGVPDRLRSLLEDELKLIADREYAHYFLTVHDIVRHARESCKPPILCQGRGSAANSAVCWVLGVTSVDPMKYDLLFSRFVSAERDEPPDIDIDFEHERREEVMQYIYTRYGRERAAIAATVIHYRPRSTVREVGRALGLTEDVTQRLTSTVWGSFSDRFGEERFQDNGFDVDNPEMARLSVLVNRLLKFPRHLSQHVGGFVLTQDRLDETVPIHNGAMKGRTFVEWDKDDIDCLGLMKVDVLALGMLTCIRKAFDLMEENGLGRPDLDTLAVDEDKRVYQMLQKGDSIGVFQVESRAQINMLPRLKPKEFYDLVVQVAIVRPGPIEGDMVHPYLRRRAEKEAVEYPSPAAPHDPNELRSLLGITYGVPLFQEQAMKLAITAAGFSPDEANQLRRAMATFRHVGTIQNFRTKMVEGMAGRGYERDFAERCFKQIEGFGSYGFPESHALSFARLVYVSSWLKCFHPAVFCAAILNSQPMGFYAPAQLVRDAVEHGVTVLPPDVNASVWDNGLESCPARSAGTTMPRMVEDRPDDLTRHWGPLAKGERWRGIAANDPLVEAPLHHPSDGPPPRAGEDFAVRLGLRQIDGFREEWAGRIAAAAPFASIEDLARRAELPPRALRLLADADACRSLGQGRREAGWEVRRTPPAQLPLFAAADAPELGREPDVALPAMPMSEEVAIDYRTTRLSLKDHPMTFLRPLFRSEGVKSSAEAAAMKDGRRASVAGVVLVRHRPGKGNAIFVTVEDETGITNALMWARDFEANRRAVMASRVMVLHGVIQRSEEGVVHLVTTRVDDRTHELARLSSDFDGHAKPSTAHTVPKAPIRSADPRGDGKRDTRATGMRGGHPRDVRLLPKSRDFH